MSYEKQYLWRIYRLRQRPGKYWNSRPIEDWCECGTVATATNDEDEAAARALAIVGRISLSIRVEPVDEFYRPVSLQE